MQDACGRNIDYLRISLTDRCNLRCVYCMPAEGVQLVAHEDILRLYEVEKLVALLAPLGVHRIRLTGGEPLIRKGVVDLVAALARIPGIDDIAMTTNGILLPRFAQQLKDAGLSRINISLDTLDSSQYRSITRGGDITSVFAGIDSALEAGLHPVKLNAVAVRSLHQDFFSFAKLSIDRPLYVRFIEYMPVGNSFGAHGCGWGQADLISCDEIRQQIDEAALEAGLGPLQAVHDSPEGAGPACYYHFEGSLGSVGFISPLSRRFCADCNKLRLTAQGALRPCLFSDTEFSVREALRAGDDDALLALVDEALRIKPDAHHEGKRARATSTNMNAIGG